MAMKKTAAKTTAKSKTTKKKTAVTNQHLRDLQKETKRLKGLYDPTARPGFKFGKGTI